MNVDYIIKDVKEKYDINLDGEILVYDSKKELASVHFPIGQWYDNDVFESYGKYVYCEKWS